MVAKSFQAMEQICEPYLANGKMYVQVKNAKTGTIRTVRFYTETEYFKMYPEERKNIKKIDGTAKTQKTVLGFEKGYITIFKGKISENEEWFQEKQECRYTRYWGWYVVSTETVPEDIPEGIEPVRLKWDIVGTEDGSLVGEDRVIAAVESILYDESPSQFIGSIGERLDLNVTIIGNYPVEGNFGSSIIHTMQDKAENVYVWTTASKSWPVGAEKHIRGTVKDHRTYRNVRETVLTRCMEV